MMVAPRYVLAGIGGLTAAALAALASEAVPTHPNRSQAIEFQQLTHGLGLGAQAHLGRCGLAMDPRLDDQGGQWMALLPGGENWCPCGALPVMPLVPVAAEVHLQFSRRPDGAHR
jgi:hypothetical protein